MICNLFSTLSNSTLNNSTSNNSTDVDEYDQTEAPTDDEEDSSSDEDETEAPQTEANVGRRRRSLEEILDEDRQRLEHMRKKRAIKYKCKKKKEVTLGVMFYDLYHKDGIKARKCCCTPYKGELYSFNVTVDQSWIEILEDKRSNTFRFLMHCF